MQITETVGMKNWRPPYILRLFRRAGRTPAFFEGVMRFRRLPHDMAPEEFRRYYGLMSERERDRLTVHEAKNILTTNGRNQLLTFIGSSSLGTQPFAQYWAVGTFPINSVNPGDTSVQTEIFRVAPTSAIITGTQVDILFQIGSTQANGTLTNAGIYGGGSATSSSGTGTLYTHALLNSFVKSNGNAYAVDYLINVN